MSDTPVPVPSPGPGPRTLLGRLRAAVRARHYSPRTEQAYVAWVRRYVQFHDRRHPATMGSTEVQAFLTHLAERGRVSASTQNQAAAGLLFLYEAVLGRPLAVAPDGVVHAKEGHRLPVVLTRDEVRVVLRGLRRVQRSSGRGGGCFRRRGATPMPQAASSGAITCTRPPSSAP